MEFNIVIGNPPYNNDLYLDFVQAGYEALKPDGVMVMITPASWLIRTNEQYIKAREILLPHMEKIVHMLEHQDVFDLNICMALSYYLIHKSEDIIRTVEVVNECKKNSMLTGEINRVLWDSNKRTKERYFSLNNRINDLYERIYTDEKLNGHIRKFAYKIDKNNEHKVSEYDSFLEASKVVAQFIGEDGKAHNTAKEKLTLSNDGKAVVINKPRVDKTAEVTIFSSDSKDECEAFSSWLSSRLIRCLILGRYNIGRSLFSDTDVLKYLPMPSKFDAVRDNDGWFDYFNCSQDERDFVNGVIRDWSR